MKIDRIEIISFGKFKNKNIDFTDGLNIIYGNNESGKSTIISFIYAMLYGFGESRTKALSLREKYTPWDGSVCEGRILVTTDDGKHISIYRKAGSVKKYDILHIHDTDTGEELSLSPEEIVGVSSDTFLKTLCVRQLSVSPDGTNDEISQKLSNIASGGDESVSFEKAQKILDSIRREIQPQRGSGGLYAEITKKLAQAQMAQSEQKEAENELSNLLSLISEEEKRKEAIKKELDALSEIDYSSSVAHISGRLEEINKYSVKPTDFIILSGGFLAFILMLFINLPYALIIFILFLLALAAVGIKSKFSANNNAESLIKEKDILLSKKEENEKKILSLRERLRLSEERLVSMKVREEALKISTQKSSVDTRSLQDEKARLEKRLRTISLTSKALSSAYENMQKNFTPELNKKASYYFGKIVGGKYSRIFCDKDFSISIESTIPRESGFFSGGTVDQLYLSLRLALTDMLFGEKSAPIILDQPFLQYDSERKENALELFKNMEKHRQIILFTADKGLTDTNIDIVPDFEV